MARRWTRVLIGIVLLGGLAVGSAVRLGLLTIPVGPADAPFTGKLRQAHGEAYSALDKLAYGYSTPSGCVTAAPVLAPPDARCIEWTFVSAAPAA